MLIYSVCTLTRAETVDIADVPIEGFAPEPLLAATDEEAPSPWRPLGHGGAVLPHDHDTDGMAVFRWRFSG